jgi:hypothetical protein
MGNMEWLVGAGLFLLAAIWELQGIARRHRHYSRHELVVRWPRHVHGSEKWDRLQPVVDRLKPVPQGTPASQI